MKYYVYISDTKVDMFYSQIPSKFLNKFSKSFKVDLKVFSATLTDKTEQNTRYMKCKIVSDYIQKNLKVGTIKDPETYIMDTIPMKWGFLPHLILNLVLFCASRDDALVAFSGSDRHVIGKDPRTDMSRLKPEFVEFGGGLFSYFSEFKRILLFDEHDEFEYKPDEDDNSYLIDVIERIIEMYELYSQNLEFLSRVQILEKDKAKSRNVIFGSPIYVALADI